MSHVLPAPEPAPAPERAADPPAAARDAAAADPAAAAVEAATQALARFEAGMRACVFPGEARALGLPESIIFPAAWQGWKGGAWGERNRQYMPEHYVALAKLGLVKHPAFLADADERIAEGERLRKALAAAQRTRRAADWHAAAPARRTTPRRAALRAVQAMQGAAGEVAAAEGSDEGGGEGSDEDDDDDYASECEGKRKRVARPPMPPQPRRAAPVGGTAPWAAYAVGDGALKRPATETPMAARDLPAPVHDFFAPLLPLLAADNASGYAGVYHEGGRQKNGRPRPGWQFTMKLGGRSGVATQLGKSDDRELAAMLAIAWHLDARLHSQKAVHAFMMWLHDDAARLGAWRAECATEAKLRELHAKLAPA